MAETEKQTPVTQSFCGSLRRDGHWKCLGLTLMITGCLATVFWCHFDSTEKVPLVHRDGLKRTVMLTYMDVSFSSADKSGPCRRGYIYIPVACAVMLYLVYLVECWHSHAWLELRYKDDISSVYSNIKKMQHALPVIWWKATCYHYVRRTRQVTRYRNGDAFTSTQVYYERVNSSTAGAAFNFTRCGVKDISRPLSDLEKYPAIKIKISKGFSFANLDTEFEFEEQRSQFFQEYETKDDYMEGREGMDLINVDFKEYTIAFRDPNNLPWYVSHAVFWIASLILLSWPLRTIIEFKTAHLHYHIHKLFGSNYLDLDNYPGLISRVSTMNSSEFEMSIRNNNVIVPSYSEAIITDINDQIDRRDYGAIKMCKFPRSLTNFAFARKPSICTPAVTMNQVKKFKSCNVFGKSESTDLSLNSLRRQIQQVVRENGRNQGKQSSTSQYSISSLGNGVIYNRFVHSPDELTASATLQCYTSKPKKKVGEFSSGEAESSKKSSPARIKRYSSTNMTFQRPGCRSIRLYTDTPSQFCLLSRSKSVPGTNIQQDKTDRSSYQTGTSLEFMSPALDPDCTSTPSTAPFVELPGNNCISSTLSTKTTPTPPSSPPDYEDAIKMRHFSPSLISGNDFRSPNHFSKIELSGNSATKQTRTTLPTIGGPALSTCRGKPNLGLENPSIDSGFNHRHSKNPSRVICDVAALKRSDVQSITRSDGGKYSFSEHEKQTITKPTFKQLPKVCKISSIDSNDSDFGCLHSTSFNMAHLDNEQSNDNSFSNQTSQVQTFDIESNSRLVSTVIAAGNSAGSQTVMDTPSDSSSVVASVTDSNSAAFSSKDRMETSV